MIDVNIPKHLTDLDEDYEHAEDETKEERAREGLLLATYLWENYIELSDATNVFILGVGAAYSSIIELLKSNERITDRIDRLFFFVAEQSLNSCRSATDENLSLWYYDASMVFTAQDHHIWEYSNQRKPKKRFGRLIRSPFDDVQQMLAHHRQEVTEVMLALTAGWEEPGDGGLDDFDGVKVGDDAGLAGGGAESEDELMGLTTVKDGVRENALASPVRLPAVGNFALSPSRRAGSPTRR